MASSTRKSALVARIAKTLKVSVDGVDVHMPVGKAENQVMNCLLVSQVRTMVQENLKKIREMEAPITPRELKDLVDAVGSLAKHSAEVYQDLDGEIEKKEEKPADTVEVDATKEDDFDVLTKPKQDERTNDQPDPASPATPGGAPDGA